MRFRIYVWVLETNLSPAFRAMGAGANGFDAALLEQLRDAMESNARAVYLVDSSAMTITRLR